MKKSEFDQRFSECCTTVTSAKGKPLSHGLGGTTEFPVTAGIDGKMFRNDSND